MNLLKSGVFSLAIAAALSSMAHAQFRDAGSKIRGDAMAGHEAVWNLQSAQGHAQSLYYYTQVEPASPASTTAPAVISAQAHEHVQSIQSDIAKSLKSLTVLKVTYANDQLAQAEIEKIEKLLGGVKAHCGTCAEECVKADLGSARLMDCCVEMFQDLDAAHTQTTALIKHLKLEKLPAMPKKAAAGVRSSK